MASALLPSPFFPLSSLCISRHSPESVAFYCLCHSWLRRDSSAEWRTISMRDRSKNRKPLQKGRNLSSEAIQAIQALKRARRHGDEGDSWVGGPGRRHRVFEEIRKEYWYKPKLSVYVDLISVLARNGSLEEVERVCSYLMMERWDPDTEGFNSLLRTLLDFGRIHTTMDCYRLMKLWESDPDEATFKILICGLESMGEMDIAASLKQEAERYFGSLDFLEEDEETVPA
ncbi:unnamed protein product [Spirodela intermedia]|uniref:Uncharacterized protein n=1 Tax=Spirodela intermedia TaxID=51605 RepID=A0A7I8JRB3_SPIIN|nr:unnamed protein product [Spirodela intermedia]CAA6672305.1 unnamed protein product [Spirodela intermedia]